ncbi:hypothetical protein [Sediminibacillus albus]|uniref:Uncharacterized protein n=1 Tax=Sediminibacillus albus TaxID=407036 RepID=A0A1G8XC26_9BACI|nr:hypothetical protein [Sediminibacillus albus]SDJ87340.1 hypothetical protein SAMN05216243_1247 [Sediminibacillus albus]
MYMVYPCFDWIGFHIVQKLLHEGNQVVGIGEAKTKKQENFLSFLARNSSFHLYKNLEECKNCLEDNRLQAIIQLESQRTQPIMESIQTDKHLVLSRTRKDAEMMEQESCLHIKLPLLYGEWMPRTDNGLCDPDGGIICFDSDQFVTQAVYIEDFTEGLLELLESNSQTGIIRIELSDTEKNDRQSGDAVFPVKESQDLQKRIKTLEEHYRFHRHFY